MEIILRLIPCWIILVTYISNEINKNALYNLILWFS